MTERKMTEKGFLRKATSGKISAAAFIAAHREFLTTGTLASMTAPILAKLDGGEIMPTPALSEINSAVLAHMVAKDILKGEAAMNAGPRAVKPYTATVYDAEGNVCTRKTEEGEIKDLIQNFEDTVKAEGWCDRRLDTEAPDSYALIVNNGNGRVQRVERDASIARLYGGRKPSPVMKQQSSSGGAWKMKCKGDHFHFSKG
jgi:hypothetical protein